jgi:hypothetical protein
VVVVAKGQADQYQEAAEDLLGQPFGQPAVWSASDLRPDDRSAMHTGNMNQ